MIKVTNKGRIVKVVEENDYVRCIVLNKDVTLQPKEYFCKAMNLTIECDSDLDECWVHSDIIKNYETQIMLEGSELLGLLSYRITKEDGLYSLNICGGYLGDKEYTIPKGTVIADIHYSIKNLYNTDTKELNYKSFYQDDNVIIKAKDGYIGNFEIIINPDDTSYIKVNLPS